jgi:Putative cyclase
MKQIARAAAHCVSVSLSLPHEPTTILHRPPERSARRTRHGSTRAKDDLAHMKMPIYDELPRDSDGFPTASGLFGADDSIGRLNLITSEVVVDAARLVRRGETFAFDVAIDTFNPPLDDGRQIASHRVLPYRDSNDDVEGFDDVLDNYFPQIASQWDSLAHIAGSPNVFYNNHSVEDVTTGGFNTIDHVARRGIVTRGVLLDLPAFSPNDLDDASHGSIAITVDDLERVRVAAGATYSPGCAIVIRTGFLAWYRRQSPAARHELSQDLRAPGIEHSEAMARYLWDSGAAAIVSDVFATEVWPPDFSKEAEPFGYLHRVLIGRLGFTIGELFDLEAISEDSRADGVYEFLLASAPLHVPHGIGSPANAIGIK